MERPCPAKRFDEAPRGEDAIRLGQPPQMPVMLTVDGGSSVSQNYTFLENELACKLFPSRIKLNTKEVKNL